MRDWKPTSALDHRWADARLLGSGFIRRQNEVALRIGQQAWTRAQLVTDLGCANVQAAARLTKAAEAFDARDATQLAARIGIRDLMMLDGVGIVTAYVWLCLLDRLGIDPLVWLDRHNDLVTLGTEKARALRDRANGAKSRSRGPGKQRKGFAVLRQAQRAAMARRGGPAAYRNGTAHRWTSNKATSAGRKGGRGRGKRATAGR